jgi:hypothetical protein
MCTTRHRFVYGGDCPGWCARGAVARVTVGVVLVLLLHLSPSCPAAIIDLTLNSEAFNKLASYDFYAWDEGGWELDRCPMGDVVFFTKVFTWDKSPNQVGMHLLDVEHNSSYVFDLGVALTATFRWLESRHGGGGGSTGLPSRKNLDFGFVSYQDTPTKETSNVPEPASISLLTCLLPLAARFVRAIRV